MSFIMQTAAWAILFSIAFTEIDELRRLIKELRNRKDEEETAELAKKFAGISDRIVAEQIRADALVARIAHIDNLVATRLGERQQSLKEGQDDNRGSHSTDV